MALGLSTAITALNLSDTFTTLRDRINSIITKINTIDVNSTTMNMGFSSSAPSDSTLDNSEGALYLDSSGALKLKVKNSAGSVTIYTVTVTS